MNSLDDYLRMTWSEWKDKSSSAFYGLEFFMLLQELAWRINDLEKEECSCKKRKK